MDGVVRNVFCGISSRWINLSNEENSGQSSSLEQRLETPDDVALK